MFGTTKQAWETFREFPDFREKINQKSSSRQLFPSLRALTLSRLGGDTLTPHLTLLCFKNQKKIMELCKYMTFPQILYGNRKTKNYENSEMMYTSLIIHYMLTLWQKHVIRCLRELQFCTWTNFRSRNSNMDLIL